MRDFICGVLVTLLFVGAASRVGCCVDNAPTTVHCDCGAVNKTQEMLPAIEDASK